MSRRKSPPLKHFRLPDNRSACDTRYPPQPLVGLDFANPQRIAAKNVDVLDVELYDRDPTRVAAAEGCAPDSTA